MKICYNWSVLWSDKWYWIIVLAKWIDCRRLAEFGGYLALLFVGWISFKWEAVHLWNRRQWDWKLYTGERLINGRDPLTASLLLLLLLRLLLVRKSVIHQKWRSSNQTSRSNNRNGNNNNQATQKRNWNWNYRNSFQGGSTLFRCFYQHIYVWKKSYRNHEQSDEESLLNTLYEHQFSILILR